MVFKYQNEYATYKLELKKETSASSTFMGHETEEQEIQDRYYEKMENSYNMKIGTEEM